MKTHANHRIIAWGDSITFGYLLPDHEKWPVMLQQNLTDATGDAWQVVNAGVNGNTSADGLARFERDIQPHLPATVFIEFGGNDSTPVAERAVTLDAFEQNLRTMHELVTQRGGNVIFVAFPPVDNSQHRFGHHEKFATVGGFDQYVQQYRETMHRIAHALDCPFFDLDRLLRLAANRQGQATIMAPDGIHLTAVANEHVAQALCEYLLADPDSTSVSQAE